MFIEMLLTTSMATASQDPIWDALIVEEYRVANTDTFGFPIESVDVEVTLDEELLTSLEADNLD